MPTGKRFLDEGQELAYGMARDTPRLARLRTSTRASVGFIQSEERARPRPLAGEETDERESESRGSESGRFCVRSTFHTNAIGIWHCYMRRCACRFNSRSGRHLHQFVRTRFGFARIRFRFVVGSIRQVLCRNGHRASQGKQREKEQREALPAHREPRNYL